MHYREGLHFRHGAQNWSADRKRDWILHRLRFTVRRAYKDIPFYRERFDASGFDPSADFTFDDYSRLPILERSELANAGKALRATTLPAELIRQDATGGSTGQPTIIWTGPEERGWRESGTEHFMRRLGVPKGSSVALLWGHHLDPVGSDRLADRLRAFAENVRWFDCLRLSPEFLQEYDRQLRGWRPRCLIAYASALGALAEEVARSGALPDYPRRCFVTGAEKLMPHHRRLIESVFQRPVYERYGSRDIGLMGFQTTRDEAPPYEVDWANVLLEPETDGAEASIIVTKLHADAMPMLRYRVGDVGRFPEASRAGTPALVLHAVIGRDSDRVWLPNGRWVHGIAFPHLMKDFPVREFQIHQAQDYSVTIAIVPGDQFSAADSEAIVRTVQSNLPGLPIAVRLVTEIPRTRSNKWRPVITEVQQRATTEPVV